MESYSLYQLNEYVRRVIALNFREPLWIETEISQVKESRGNYYLELIEKDEEGDGIIAQTSAVIWYRNYKFISKKIGDIIDDLLEDGTLVRIKCKVDFHERYGLKLVIEDIDSSVIQRVAVISSAGAAGYQDFKNQLKNNTYGYTFKLDLYDCAVQGVAVSKDTVAAIEEIKSSKTKYDIVAIIRGGGSKLDLSGYDDFKIAEAVALSEIPFVIGIGHDIDSTVTDLVACVSLKTPTAVADYVVERNMHFEARLEQVVSSITKMASLEIASNQQQISSLSERLMSSWMFQLSSYESDLSLLEHQLDAEVSSRLTQMGNNLEQIALKLDAKDPALILSQGYGILKKNGSSVTSTKDIDLEDELTISLHDGEVQSVVTKI